jgi:hypothetical protein
VRLDRDRIKLLPKEIRNILYIWAVRLFRNVHQTFSKSDIAYMYVEHPVILPFILKVRRHIGINIHIVKPGEDFSRYRKVIIPNGLWPKVKSATDAIALDKRVYCEIGFFPQARNVYFDSQGVHGHSSIRHADLSKLTDDVTARVAAFRDNYAGRNYVRVKWDSVELDGNITDESAQVYGKNFVFVPLQLERDTAFELCPFRNNQEIVEYVEQALPGEKIIFKVHPLDVDSEYHVSAKNLLLPASNRDLKSLIVQSKAVVGSNSTVILEALMLRKKCATYGVGFTTNHNVTLECHEDLERLSTLDSWQPDLQKIDAFLSLLLSKQISVDFQMSKYETEKLIRIFREHKIILT